MITAKWNSFLGMQPTFRHVPPIPHVVPKNNFYKNKKQLSYVLKESHQNMYFKLQKSKMSHLFILPAGDGFTKSATAVFTPSLPAAFAA